MLQRHLEETYANELIDFMTIDKFVCSICRTTEPDYQKASEKLIDMYLSGTFPYVHVIVDEGQDFGRDKMEEADLLQSIHDTVVNNDQVNGTFYVFYDALQLIQATAIPQYISEADCKLTLYRNCRNTANIAITSLKPIYERNPKLKPGALNGVPAKIYFCNEERLVDRLNGIIGALKDDGITDVVILTVKDENHSILTGISADGIFKRKQFTSCRKFKGLEADAIILIDIDEDTFLENAVQRFYVGASRARLRLELLTSLNDDQSTVILSETLHYNKRIRNAKRDLAVALNALPVID